MSDIVEQLRALAFVRPREKCVPEAADEIQILRGQVEALHNERDRLWTEKLITQGEITRLREENARLREVLKQCEQALQAESTFHAYGRLLYLIDGDKANAACAAIREGGKDD